MIWKVIWRTEYIELVDGETKKEAHDNWAAGYGRHDTREIREQRLVAIVPDECDLTDLKREW